MSNETEKVKYVSYLDHEGEHKGILSWIFATDHKRIALLYLYNNKRLH